MRKGQRSWGRVLAPNSRNKANMAKHKNFNFRAYHSFGTLKAVSLQLNGMFLMWKIQQAMQDDAIRAARIHPAFIPVTVLKCSYGEITSPLTEISGTVPAHPLIWTHRTFYKGFRGKGEISKTGLMWRGPNIGKTTTLNVHRAFLYISLPSLHDYDVKFPHFTFCGGREPKTTSFFFT